MRQLSTRILIALCAFLYVMPTTAHASTRGGNDISNNDKGVKPSKYAEVARLVIPSLGINEKVIPGTTMDVYNRGVGLWPTSPLAGQRGNFVVGGHRTSGRKPFRYIDKLRVGDSIVVRQGGDEFVYKVTRRRIVKPTDIWVAKPTKTATLTLFACHPVGSVKERIVVQATLSP